MEKLGDSRIRFNALSRLALNDVLWTIAVRGTERLNKPPLLLFTGKDTFHPPDDLIA